MEFMLCNSRCELHVSLTSIFFAVVLEAADCDTDDSAILHLVDREHETVDVVLHDGAGFRHRPVP
jgi:hypothetical protein